MFNIAKRAVLASVAVLPLMASTAWAEGLISIIVNDPANPCWFTEGEVAQATTEELANTAANAAPFTLSE